MYLGLSLAYLGEAAMLRQLWPVLLLPLVAAYLNWTVIPLEEARLREAFPRALRRCFRLRCDGARKIAEDARVERIKRVPVEGAEEAPWRKNRGLHQSGARPFFHDVPLQPGLAGDFHLRAQTEHAAGLDRFDAPEVESLSNQQLTGIAPPAA